MLTNCWYVAAWADELSTSPLGRRIANEPIVMFRDAAGAPVALEDRCPHRAMPLSKGEWHDGIIRCPYHGIEFDGAGRCVKVPGISARPRALSVRQYPLVQRDRLLWVWPGDAEAADPSLIPDHPFHDDPAWNWRPHCLRIEADSALVHDNLLDLNHVGYVHRRTIGGEGEPEIHATCEQKIEQGPNDVRVTRWFVDVPAPPLYRRAAGFEGNIDRWQEVYFRPGLVRVSIGAWGSDYGTHRDSPTIGGMQLRALNAVTPETESSSLYFWSFARNFDLDNQELDRVLDAGLASTFEEDRVVLEYQQQRLSESSRPIINLKQDAGSVHARAIVERRRSALFAAPDRGLSETKNVTA